MPSVVSTRAPAPSSLGAGTGPSRSRWRGGRRPWCTPSTSVPDRGAARFAKIGLPEPEFLASFVASFEVVCGALILLGLLTRPAVIPTTVIMVVAIMTTKIPILVDRGFWDMAHAARTDFAMLLGSVFLLAVGAGPWSVDSAVSRANRAGVAG